ncbi:hypothetical protein KBD81_00385 [Candidatus Woesebacteria bacterium]|nr:hypothetical protein [Candidatus Woesebacteria bacterium]
MQVKQPEFTLPNNRLTKIPKGKQKQVEYISDYNKKSWMYNPDDEKFLFGIPNPYIVPDHRYFREFFYWDSFYILLGLLLYKDTKNLCSGILQNFASEVKRFGRIPNSNAYYSLSRSQSPYFAIAIQEYLKVYPEDLDSVWMQQCVDMAIEEYEFYWLGTDKRYADHLTPTGLSRYWDLHDDADIFSEYESGWDTTSRFRGECLMTLPIDLNSQLAMYERFFSWWFTQKKDSEKAQKWKAASEKRFELITAYCWDEKERIFFDYNYVKSTKTGFVSAASFFPFYAQIATEDQAKKSLPVLLAKLECEGGIVNTQKVSAGASLKNQWDHPLGWAPLNYVAYMALKNYGFKEDADRIKAKWLAVCDYWFEQDECFYEKYDVVKVGRKIKCLTPARVGFGWTNSIYLNFILNEI